MTERECRAVAGAFGLAGLALGVAIVLGREPGALWIGLAGLALGWSYHGPPLRLAYGGLGELDVALVYGPGVVVSTHLVLTGEWGADALRASLPLGTVIAAFLWVSQFPDHDADRRAGKLNGVARLGKPAAARLLPLWYALALVLTLALPAFGLPGASVLGALFVVPAAAACRHVLRDPERFHRHTPAQPLALAAFLVYPLGAGLGTVPG